MASDQWRTPPELYAALDSEFGFGLDAAADPINALHRSYFGEGGAAPDALAVAHWAAHRLDGDAIYLNPPYSETGKWVHKAFEQSAMMSRDHAIVLLVPAMPSEGWWQTLRHATEIREIPHRLKFLMPDGKTKDSARFASVVIVFRPQPGIRGPRSPRVVTWSFRP